MNKEEKCTEYMKTVGIGSIVMGEIRYAFDNGWDACEEAQTASSFAGLQTWADVSSPTGLCRKLFPWWTGDSKTDAWTWFCEGYEAWRQLGVSRCMITTDDNSLEFFLKRDLPPDISIGLKTRSVCLGLDIADNLRWREIASKCCQIVAHTGQDAVALDNEGLLKPMLSDGAVSRPSFARWTAALVQLKTVGVPIVFNLPSVLKPGVNFADRRSYTINLVKCFAQVLPDALFMTGYRARPGNKENEGQMALARNMHAAVGAERVVPRIFVNPECWGIRPYYQPVGGLLEANRMLEAYGRANLWTGAKHWCSVPAYIADVVAAEGG